jgi:hypothetical protein
MNIYQRVLEMMGVSPEKTEESPGSDSNKKKGLAETTVAAALTGIYHKACSKQGADEISVFLAHRRKELEEPNIGICLTITFGERTEEVVKAIALHTKTERKAGHHKLYEACRCGYLVLADETISDHKNSESITHFMVTQRHHILSRLPDSLQLGKILGDTTLDDKTNKMEGPVSNIMHKLGESFSESPK